jgi:hypothetical protein
MNNYIIISRTFVEVTPDSAEDGEFSDHGFIDERVEVTFPELVDLMTEHHHPSCSPNDGGTDVSYSTEMYTSDFGDGTNRQESIHYHKDNTPNIAKYWKMAARAAGLVK